MTTFTIGKRTMWVVIDDERQTVSFVVTPLVPDFGRIVATTIGNEDELAQYRQGFVSGIAVGRWEREAHGESS